MNSRLTLISCGATGATRNATFPLDEELEPKAMTEARRYASAIREADRHLRSPALAASQTVLALGIGGAMGEGRAGAGKIGVAGRGVEGPLRDAEIDAALADLDLGRWAGRSLMEIQAHEPEGLGSWLSDPSASPHGGEAITDLMSRMDHWLRLQAAYPGHTLAVTHAGCIRAAAIVILGAPATAFWRIDIAPLTFTQLTAQDGNWRLRSMGNRFKDAAFEAD